MFEGKELEIQRKNAGLKKGEKIEDYWIQLCKKCGSCVEEGITITETDGGDGNSSQG